MNKHAHSTSPIIKRRWSIINWVVQLFFLSSVVNIENDMTKHICLLSTWFHHVKLQTLRDVLQHLCKALNTARNVQAVWNALQNI